MAVRVVCVGFAIILQRAVDYIGQRFSNFCWQFLRRCEDIIVKRENKRTFVHTTVCKVGGSVDDASAGRSMLSVMRRVMTSSLSVLLSTLTRL